MVGRLGNISIISYCLMSSTCIMIYYISVYQNVIIPNEHEINASSTRYM